MLVSALSSSTTKKVYLRRLDSSYVEGYVSPHSYLRPEGVEILTRSAQVEQIPYHQIRAVYFVRDFEGPPDDSEKRTFGSRPKTDGLWLRLTFRDGEVYEGVMPNDLLQMTEHGVAFAPPDSGGMTQRIFVPRKALQNVQVMGVIGSPAHRRRSRRKEPPKDQRRLFAQET